MQLPLTRNALVVVLLAWLLGACGGSDEPAAQRTAAEGMPTSAHLNSGRTPEIAFTRDGEEGEMFPEIHLMDADGDQKMKLTHSPKAADDDPAFSPDGRRIAFARWEGRDSDIYAVNIDGSDEQQITDTPGKRDLGPTFSPDGERIAFTSDRDSPGDRLGAPTSIYLMSADGSDVMPITEGPRDGSPAWSPDGQRIAFTRGRDRQDGSGKAVSVSELWLMADDGSGQTKVRHGSDLIDLCCPAFSPDGERIAFIGFWEGDRHHSLATISVAGGDPAKLTSPRFQALGVPSWSPDGQRIAFKGSRTPHHGHLSGIYIIDANGGKPEHVAGTEGNDGAPDWSAASGQ